MKLLSKKRIKALENLHKFPKTQKQLEALSRGRKLPRTLAQRKALSKGRKIAQKLPRTNKQLQANMSGNTIVEHHNDLCHGALRPDDVSYITCSEHATLHWKLRLGIDDG